jgi:hypothetical protein
MSYITKEAYDDDIVVRLRNWRGRHLAHCGELFEQAADEIERLYAEIERLRTTPASSLPLTDAELEAVAIAQRYYAHECETDGVTNEDVMVANTLRALLARATKEGGQ